MSLARGIGLAFVAYAAWSFGDAAIKALPERLGIFQIAFFASLGGLVVVPLLARRGGYHAMLRPRRPWLVWARGLTTWATLPLNVIALHNLTLSEFYAIIFVMPIVVLIASAALLGERLGWQRTLAVAVGFLGVLVAVRPGFRELNLGHLTAFGSVICSAASIMLARATANERPVTMLGTLYAVLIGGHGLAMIPGFALPTASELGLLALAAVFGASAQLAILGAARMIPAGLVAPAQYSQIIAAAVLGIVFFNEPPDGWTLIGVALLAVAGFGIFRPDRLWREQRERRRAAA